MYGSVTVSLNLMRIVITVELPEIAGGGPGAAASHDLEGLHGEEMAARRAVDGHGGAGSQAGRGSVLRQLQLEAGAARRHERHDLRGDAVLEVVRRQDLDRPRPRFDGRNELGGDRAEKEE